MIKIRLSGLPEDIEAVTREIRRQLDVLEESGSYANRQSKLIRRYLAVRSPLPGYLNVTVESED